MMNRKYITTHDLYIENNIQSIKNQIYIL